MKLPRRADFARFAGDPVWRQAAESICQNHQIAYRDIIRAAQGDNIIFMVDDRFVVKIYNPRGTGAEREKIALENARTNLKIPEIVASGAIEEYRYLILTQLGGEQIKRDEWLKMDESEQIPILARLAEALRELHASDAARIEFDWENFIERQAATCYERQKSCGVNDRLLAEIPAYLEENLRLLPRNVDPVFLHGDVHFGNLRFAESNGKLEISGLFDFADSLKGFHEYEFVAVGVLMIQGQGALQREFFRAFGYAEHEIDEELRKRLMLLTMFYECSDLRRYAIRLRPEAVEYSLLELEREIWNFC
ncbi:MAG TPA: aminoglycoside phosphotransferase family protein [Pyrinomonadaceae bacterium]|jgi:Ser/Thr protein kinase RdoA (MazF antagonist)